MSQAKPSIYLSRIGGAREEALMLENSVKRNGIWIISSVRYFKWSFRCTRVEFPVDAADGICK